MAKVMIDHPEIKKLEVQGHTDNHGDSKANKKLSEQRAQAVVKWLVSQGLARRASRPWAMAMSVRSTRTRPKTGAR